MLYPPAWEPPQKLALLGAVMSAQLLSSKENGWHPWGMRHVFREQNPEASRVSSLPVTLCLLSPAQPPHS